MSTASKIFVGIILLMVVAGGVAYPHLSERVVSHWDVTGQANGTMSRFWGVVLLPLIATVLFLLSLVIPRIDPLHSNIGTFRKTYNGFWLSIAVFFAYIYGLTLAWNLGMQFSFSLALAPAFGVLWWMIAVFLERSKRNWFVGIRTPWTLANDQVWDATHRLGARLFKIAAPLAVVGMLVPHLALVFVVAPALIIAAVTVVYSYVMWRRMQRAAGR